MATGMRSECKSNLALNNVLPGDIVSDWMQFVRLSLFNLVEYQTIIVGSDVAILEAKVPHMRS